MKKANGPSARTGVVLRFPSSRVRTLRMTRRPDEGPPRIDPDDDPTPPKGRGPKLAA